MNALTRSTGLDIKLLEQAELSPEFIQELNMLTGKEFTEEEILAIIENIQKNQAQIEGFRNVVNGVAIIGENSKRFQLQKQRFKKERKYFEFFRKTKDEQD